MAAGPPLHHRLMDGTDLLPVLYLGIIPGIVGHQVGILPPAVLASTKSRHWRVCAYVSEEWLRIVTLGMSASTKR